MQEREILEGYSRGEIAAVDARRRLGDITYGELFRMLVDAGYHLPRAPNAGREADLERAREWLFPKGTDKTKAHVDGQPPIGTERDGSDSIWSVSELIGLCVGIIEISRFHVDIKMWDDFGNEAKIRLESVFRFHGGLMWREYNSDAAKGDFPCGALLEKKIIKSVYSQNTLFELTMDNDLILKDCRAGTAMSLAL